MLIPFADLDSKIAEIFFYSNYKGGSWYYKGAKMCLIWPIWHKAFPEAEWIIVRRDDAVRADLVPAKVHHRRRVQDADLGDE